VISWQKQGIPPIAVGRNVTLTAETGCGKTLAFLLPLVQHIAHYKKMKYRPKEALDSPFVIIISPSRELASQTYVSSILIQDSFKLSQKFHCVPHHIFYPPFSVCCKIFVEV